VVSRPVLAGWLWENHGTKLANANLRQLLVGVRNFDAKHGLSIMQIDRSFVHLNVNMRSDLKHFTEISSLKGSKELKQYISDYRNEFLHRLEDVAGEGLRRWILATRQEYSIRLLHITRDNALRIGGKDGAKALETLHSLHPYDGSLLRALILTHSRNNDYAALYQCFDSFTARLQRDLGVAPSIKTLNLVARIAPELIPDLERDFLFLSKNPAKFATPVSADQFENAKREPPKSPLPRLIILPPAKEAFNSRSDERAMVNCLVEDLTLRLCQMRNFVILAPHTAKQFVKLHQRQPSFNVDYMVSTRLLPGGNTKKLALCLTFVPSGEVLMADEISIKKTCAYESYSNFIQSAASRIGLEIDRSVLSTFRHTGDASAYTYYLIGQNRLRTESLPNVRAARKVFRRALQVVPDFYPARQMLARTYNREWWLLGRQEKDFLLEAQRIAVTLIKDDPMTPGGYWELGTSTLYLGDIDSALESLNTAKSLAPHHADIIASVADVLSHTGLHDEALGQIDVALNLNPLPPDIYFWIASGIKFLMGDYQAAIDTSMKTTVLSPSNLRIISACYAMLGNQKMASKFRKLHLAEYPNFRVADWPKLLPAKSSRDIDHYIRALRLAGFH